MLRVFVDSASSIKQEEREKYGVEIIPLRYLMGEVEYEDGIDLSIDQFYEKLIQGKMFPKTSLPSLVELQEKISQLTNDGDDVLILTLSSGISGTYNAIVNIFKDNPKVKVVDTLSAVGGIRILVEEINKNKDKSIDEIIDILNALIPRIKILAIPETLDYLLKGGRLSKKEWVLGKIFNIKPVISFKTGKVCVDAKKIGLKSAMKHIALQIENTCDENYSIVPSYTYNAQNLEELIKITPEKYHKQMIEFDNLDPVIACHWGPNAFGFIFVQK